MAERESYNRNVEKTLSHHTDGVTKDAEENLSLGLHEEINPSPLRGEVR